EGEGGVGDAADGDEEAAGAGDVGDAVEGDAAGNLEGDAVAHGVHGALHGVQVGVVQEDGVCAGLQGLGQLRQRLHLDLHPQAVGNAGPGPADGLAHSAGQADVVVLDQHAVGEAEAVQPPAA